MKLEPLIAQRFGAVAQEFGFRRVGRTHRLRLGEHQGLILDHEEHPGRGTIVSSGWAVMVCQADVAELRWQSFGTVPRPFDRMRPLGDAAVALMPDMRPDSPGTDGESFDSASVEDMDAFCSHLATWLERDMPTARAWLDDPGAMLDVFGTAVGEMTRKPRARWYLELGLDLALMVAAGRSAEAKTEYQRRRGHVAESPNEIWELGLDAFAERYPDVVADGGPGS